MFLLQWGYFALFEAFDNGRTPGKIVAKIRVIHQSGRGINFVEALARNLVRFVAYLPGFYGVGVLAIFISKRISAWAIWLRDHWSCAIAK